MATPVITGTNPASPITFQPGETKTVRVLASDPDQVPGPPVTQTFVVADSSGNTTSVDVTLQVNQDEDLTYSAGPAPPGWTVTQDTADETVFHVTAPLA